jgi:hypothetical protein
MAAGDGSAPEPDCGDSLREIRSKLRLNQPKKRPCRPARGLAPSIGLQQGGAQRRRQHQGHMIDSDMAETMVTENWR